MADNPMEITTLPDALARISWADAEIEGLQAKLAVKDQKFDRLCADMDRRKQYVENLEYENSELRKKLEKSA